MLHVEYKEVVNQQNHPQAQECTAVLALPENKFAIGTKHGEILINTPDDEKSAPLRLTTSNYYGLNFPIRQILQRSEDQLITCHRSDKDPITHFAQWDITKPDQKPEALGNAKNVSEIEITDSGELVGIMSISGMRRIFRAKLLGPCQFEAMRAFLPYFVEAVGNHKNLTAKALKVIWSDQEMLIADGKKLYLRKKPMVLFELHLMKEFPAPITAIAINQLINDKTKMKAAIGLSNGQIYLIDDKLNIQLFLGKMNQQQIQNNHHTRVMSLAWLPNGDLVMANRDCIQTWNMKEQLIFISHTIGITNMTTSYSGYMYCLRNSGQDIVSFAFPHVQRYVAEKISKNQKTTKSHGLRQFDNNGKTLKNSREIPPQEKYCRIL